MIFSSLNSYKCLYSSVGEQLLKHATSCSCTVKCYVSNFINAKHYTSIKMGLYRTRLRTRFAALV